MATAKLPSFPNCFGGFTGGAAFQYLEAGYAHLGGMATDEWLERYETPMDPFPSVPSLIEELAAASPGTRQEWLARAEEVSQACGDWPPSLLAVDP